ncbi:MAG: outer membrane beta-barrel protein [Kofleriaceae bacterium]|nr:outer membrane beta-barrel protein [Kofleriaceae bacterium]
MRSLVLAVATLASSAAVAEPLAATASAPAPSTYELGVRVGGYGFRRDGDPRPGEGWTECRMNGFGVFGGRTLTGPLFVEAGLDMYTSADGADPMDLPVDRTSGLFSAAIGARTQITSWLRGYVQVGGGMEITKVSVPYGDTRIRDTKAMPEGFFGMGMDLRIAARTHVGASFRALLMGNFDYDPARLDTNQGWVAAPTAEDVFDPSSDVAGQAQFYVRRDL